MRLRNSRSHYSKNFMAYDEIAYLVIIIIINLELTSSSHCDCRARWSRKRTETYWFNGDDVWFGIPVCRVERTVRIVSHLCYKALYQPHHLQQQLQTTTLRLFTFLVLVLKAVCQCYTMWPLVTRVTLCYIYDSASSKHFRFQVRPCVFSALEIFLPMQYINCCFTYLLTYLIKIQVRWNFIISAFVLSAIL